MSQKRVEGRRSPARVSTPAILKSQSAYAVGLLPDDRVAQRPGGADADEPVLLGALDEEPQAKEEERQGGEESVGHIDSATRVLGAGSGRGCRT